MKVLFVLIVGILIGGAVVWIYTTKDGHSASKSAGDQVENAAKATRDAVQEKIRVLDLRPEQIKDDLDRTGKVIRRKAREVGQAISDATADARITGAIKGKLIANNDLSVLSISVFAGLLGSLLGLGGGIIIIPVLTLLFKIDIRYAIGASIVSVIATSSGAAAAYVKERMTNLRIAMVLELLVSIASFAACLPSSVNTPFLASKSSMTASITMSASLAGPARLSLARIRSIAAIACAAVSRPFSTDRSTSFWFCAFARSS